MKYLCLVYVDERKLDALSPSEMNALVAESLAYDDELRRGGHLVIASALQRVRTATTVRHQSGKVLTTDGPFAETKEQLGGFIFIEARDQQEAVQVAAAIPSGRLGAIEVRPAQPLRQP